MLYYNGPLLSAFLARREDDIWSLRDRCSGASGATMENVTSALRSNHRRTRPKRQAKAVEHRDTSYGMGDKNSFCWAPKIMEVGQSKELEPPLNHLKRKVMIS